MTNVSFLRIDHIQAFNLSFEYNFVYFIMLNDWDGVFEPFSGLSAIVENFDFACAKINGNEIKRLREN